MTNLEFLKYINAIIFVYDNYYYAYIPNIDNNNENYFENFKVGMYVKLTNEFLNNDDLYVTIQTDDIYSYDESYDVIFSNVEYSYFGNITITERISSTDYEYYAKLNNLFDMSIDEESILNFYQSFMSLIRSYAQVQNTEDIKTQIYNKVIEYYANGQTDCTLQGLNLILNSIAYSMTDTSQYSTCGCNSTLVGTSFVNGTTGTTTSTGLTTSLDCASAYKQSMYIYLVQMLSDIDFYNNFLFVDDMPNGDLINYLLALIEALESMEFTLDFTEHNNHCLCDDLQGKNISNYTILDNYKKVLNWVLNCEIEENTNKIKIYGKQFAELLPNLQF